MLMARRRDVKLDEVIEADIECAVEIFIDEGDFTEMAQQKFLKRQARVLKVEYPHANPLQIDQHLIACVNRMTEENEI